MARAMIPYVVKKRAELQAAVDYLENRTKGGRFVEVMNKAVMIGERIGKIRRGGPLYNHVEGVEVSRALAESKRKRKRTTQMSASRIENIIRDRTMHRLEYKELSAKYGYSRWILRRVIKEGGPETSTTMASRRA